MRIDSRSESESEIYLPPFCEDIAKTMGGQISPQRIENIIRLSNQHGCITHGIKRYSAIEHVIKEGIKPLTPECDKVSFWTSGWRIFLNSLCNTPSRYYDTTFFHYAHSIDDLSGEKAMTIALTNKSTLEKKGVQEAKIAPNSTTIINEIVPPESMHLLIVKKKADIIQDLQPVMFRLLEDVLKDEFHPNSSTILSL